MLESLLATEYNTDGISLFKWQHAVIQAQTSGSGLAPSTDEKLNLMAL